MAETSARSRVGLRLGDRTVDVAIPYGLPLYEVLRATGVDLDDPRLTIVDSTGALLDLYSTTGDQIPEGSVLHVLTRPRPVTTKRAARDAAPVDPAAARPATSPWWLGVAGAAAVVLAATISLDMLAGADGVGADPVLRWALAAALLVAGFALAAVGPRPGAFGTSWPTAVAALAGFAGGAATVDLAVAAGGQLMVVAGLVAATSTAAVRWSVARRTRDAAAELAGVLLVVLGVAAGAFAFTLLMGLPSVFAAAALLGAVPLALRALPSLCVDVPDEQLIDVAHVGRTIGAVRAPEPQPLGPVNERQVHRAVAGAERRRDAGTVVLSVLAAVLAPTLMLSAESGTVTGWASIGATVLVAVALGLGPRTARGVLVRWVPRVSGALLLLELAVLAGAAGGGAGVLVTVVALAVGLLVVAISVPLGRGWRSVGFSRLADTLEGFAAVLALPAALAGAGVIDVLRQVTSG
ncbi:hypothetical protein [Cellulomonas sp. KRMCY2]|uniref:hypothetical protein n=1 Tax=Cellulomonas sp. KRMCY2 TaxID=1304865 RepID=UPI00045EC106|nr:hypothetical protein [Cellulomonas sp. KRMCY2]